MGRGHSQCDKGMGWVDHCVMSHTPFVQCLLSYCAAVPGLLVYFVNVDVGQLDHATVIDMSKFVALALWLSGMSIGLEPKSLTV